MSNLKKVFTLMMAVLLIFASACNKDKTDPADEQSACLLTKITWVDEEDGNEIINLEYNTDGKLVKYTFEGETNYGIVEYNADGKISKTSEYDNGVEGYREMYTWTSNFLTTTYEQKDIDGNWVESSWKEVYTIDAVGQITETQEFHKQEGTWVENSSYNLFIWENGNIKTKERWNTETVKTVSETTLFNRIFKRSDRSLLKSVTDAISSTTIYEYDDKNNAFASLGLVVNYHGLNKNNMTKEIYTYEGGEPETFNYSYEYNDKGFPTKMTETYTSGEITDTEVTLFEYDCN